MKTYNIWSLVKLVTIVIFVSFVTGCASNDYTPTNTVHVYKYKTVEVPVLPDRPKVNCNFNKEGSSLIGNMLECIALQKTVINKVTRDPLNPVEKPLVTTDKIISKEEFDQLPESLEIIDVKDDENNINETPG